MTRVKWEAMETIVEGFVWDSGAGVEVLSSALQRKAYVILRGFDSHISKVVTTAAPLNAVSTCISSLYPAAYMRLRASWKLGGNVSITCADSRMPFS